MDKLDERFWYCSAALLAYIEIDAVRNKRRRGTISYAATKACHTDHPLGRAALVAGWLALSGWLIPHLLNSDRLSDYLEQAGS